MPTKSRAEVENLIMCYEREWNSFLHSAKRKGFSNEQISENPVILLHLFYLWIQKKRF